MSSGGNLSDPKLASILVEESTSAYDFLKQFGINLNVVGRTGGHSVARTHRVKEETSGILENVGKLITRKLIEYLNNSNEVEILKESEVVKLIENSQKIVGVEYKLKNQQTKRKFGYVILATGGYGGSSEFMEKLNISSFEKFPTTNGKWADGNGLLLSKNIGAHLIQLNQIQIHPTGMIDPSNLDSRKKWLAPESLRACGGILLNHLGKRFVNELGRRDYVTQEILSSCRPSLKKKSILRPIAYMILNEQVVNCFGRRLFNFYVEKGLIQTTKNNSEFSYLVDFDERVVSQTFSSYRESAKNGFDQFGKVLFPVVFDEKETLYFILVTPSIHYTMGGIKITENAQVLKENGEVIEGLYAVGEVTGGVHGGNRLAGNSLLECVVFPRRAIKHLLSM